MSSYQPPLDDHHFPLLGVLRADAALQALPAFSDVDDALLVQVLEEAGKADTARWQAPAAAARLRLQILRTQCGAVPATRRATA